MTLPLSSTVSDILATTTRAAADTHSDVRSDIVAFLTVIGAHEQRYQTIARALADASILERDPAKRGQFHTIKTLLDGATTRFGEMRRAVVELGQIMHDLDAVADRLDEISTPPAPADAPPDALTKGST